MNMVRIMSPYYGWALNYPELWRYSLAYKYEYYNIILELSLEKILDHGYPTEFLMYTGLLKSKKQQLIEVESGLMLLSMNG